MSVFVSVQSRGTISLPVSSRKRYHLDEPGAQVEVIEQDGQIILRPKLPVDSSQAWFWHEKWFEGEKQAESEAIEGLGTVFETGEEFVNSLPD